MIESLVFGPAYFGLVSFVYTYDSFFEALFETDVFKSEEFVDAKFLVLFDFISDCAASSSNPGLELSL